MSPREHPHSQDEHPFNHTFQILSILLFLVIWIPDSFIFRITTFLSFYIPWFISVLIGLLVFIVGGYFANASHKEVFDSGQEGVIDTGVYGRVRHPMYFGMMLVILGFIIATLSIATFVLWIFVFIGFDRMATYEERKLIERLGDAYREYQKRVPKWFPH